MRSTLLATLAIMTLLLAPAALADGGHARNGAAPVATDADHGQNESSAKKAHDLQNETTENETAENKTAERAEEATFHARMAALRDSFKENVTALIHGCRGTDPAPQGHANDTTQAEHRSWAHCVRDGMHRLHAQFHAEKKELKAERRAEREADKASH